MISSAVLRLTFGLWAALSAISSWSAASNAFEGLGDGQQQPSLQPPHGRPSPPLPGVPVIRPQAGVHIFGPNGQVVTPEDLRRGFDPGDRRLGAQPRHDDEHPEKKLTDAEKAEALRKALAPKPTTAVLRQQTLDELFKKLATAEDDETAKGISTTIERIWAHSESDTANLLMERGSAAIAAGHYPLALALFDKLVVLNPQWAEAWNKRATARFRADDLDGAMADIDQVLKLEPRHYGALAGMGLILQKSNLNKQALGVFRKALALNPRQTELRKLIDSLSLEVEGRDI
jgi:tetratricopeptide (TPR) repeat protein